MHRALLDVLTADIRAALGADLFGLYLYGSYVTGGFDADVSDLDLVAVTSAEMGELDLGRLQRMHDDFVAQRPEWRDRLDVVYIGRRALSSFRTGEGQFAVINPGTPFGVRDDAADWLMNWYLARETGEALYGPQPYVAFPSIARLEFVAAVSHNVARMRDHVYQEPSAGARAYAVLTTCRALMTVHTGTHCSKQLAAAWTRERMPEWAWLIDAALLCRLSGGTIGFDDERTRAAAQQFIRSVAGEIKAPAPPRT